MQEAAAELGPAHPPDADAATRLDMRSHYVVTIDDAATREIDDGARLLPSPRLLSSATKFSIVGSTAAIALLQSVCLHRIPRTFKFSFVSLNGIEPDGAQG